MSRRKNTGRNITGILVLDKPCGKGSNESLQIVKRLFNARKAGHTGSLDKLASGLLPLCFGEATKLSGFLLNADKRYQTTVRLGERSTTGDAEGEILETRPVPDLDQGRIDAVLQRFTGEISQVPPMFSAVKVAGQRLYKLAHQGKTIDREARQVTIHELRLQRFQSPDLELDVTCSKGTYIRTLAEDIGEALGCGARVQRLRRVCAGPFRAEQMVQLDTVEAAARDSGTTALDALLLPAESALEDVPKVSLPEASAFYLKQGQPVLVPHAPTQGLVRLYRGHGHFIGVGEVLDDGRVAPRRLFRGPI